MGKCKGYGTEIEQYNKIKDYCPKQRKPPKISNLDVLNAVLYAVEWEQVEGPALIIKGGLFLLVQYPLGFPLLGVADLPNSFLDHPHQRFVIAPA